MHATSRWYLPLYIGDNWTDLNNTSNICASFVYISFTANPSSVGRMPSSFNFNQHENYEFEFNESIYRKLNQFWKKETRRQSTWWRRKIVKRKEKWQLGHYKIAELLPIDSNRIAMNWIEEAKKGKFIFIACLPTSLHHHSFRAVSLCHRFSFFHKIFPLPKSLWDLIDVKQKRLWTLEDVDSDKRCGRLSATSVAGCW